MFLYCPLPSIHLDNWIIFTWITRNQTIGTLLVLVQSSCRGTVYKPNDAIKVGYA